MTELAISPLFSAEHMALVVEAAETLFNAVPEARVPLVIAHDRGAGSIAPAKGRGRKDPCVRGVPANTPMSPTRAPRVRLCLELIRPEIFGLVVLHELGHALGRHDGHLPPGNVMSEYPKDGAKLTECDVKFIRRKL